MTKPARNPSKTAHSTPYNSDHTDTALLHLEGAEGLLLMIGCTLENQDGQLLKNSQYAAAADTIRALLEWSVDELAQDSQGHTDTIQLLQGTGAALYAFACMHNDECSRSNNGYQMAALYSLQMVVSECSSRVTNAQEQATQHGGVAA